MGATYRSEKHNPSTTPNYSSMTTSTKGCHRPRQAATDWSTLEAYLTWNLHAITKDDENNNLESIADNGNPRIHQTHFGGITIRGLV